MPTVQHTLHCSHALGLFLFCSVVTGGEAESDCTLCNLGHYCNGTGRTEVSGPCAPGYFCLRGAKIPKPNNDSTGGICPRGSFCEAGKQPELCPPGTSISLGCFLVSGKPLSCGVNVVHCPLHLFYNAIDDYSTTTFFINVINCLLGSLFCSLRREIYCS